MGRTEKATEAEKSDRLRREGEKGERDSERAGGGEGAKVLAKWTRGRCCESRGE